jgi:hypothetical protein
MYARKSFVVSQVQIGLETILRHVALAVLVRIQRTWVDVDVGVKLLNGNFVTACLQQFADAGGNDAFSQRGNDAARDENILSLACCQSVALQCIHKNKIFMDFSFKDFLVKK